MTGGAVLGACRRDRRSARRGRRSGRADHAHVHVRPSPDDQLDEHGQGRPHVGFAFAAERAVVEVDTELGLVRVVEIATAQDAGRVLNPQGATGQVEGGTARASAWR